VKRRIKIFLYNYRSET